MLERKDNLTFIMVSVISVRLSVHSHMSSATVRSKQGLPSADNSADIDVLTVTHRTH